MNKMVTLNIKITQGDYDKLKSYVDYFEKEEYGKKAKKSQIKDEVRGMVETAIDNLPDYRD